MANEPFIEWSQNPYRWLYDQRDSYTQAILYTTRYHAIQNRDAAEKWMKETAPWKDRTIYYPATGPKKGQVKFKAGNARENLKVELFFQGDLATQYREGLTLKQNEARIDAKRGKVKEAVKTATEAYDKKFLEYTSGDILAVELLFRHGSEKKVPYAIWLEVANNGKYAIISRAVEYWGRKMMSQIRSFLNLKQFRKEADYYGYGSYKEAFEQYMAGGVTSTGQPIRGEFTEAVKTMRAYRRTQYNSQKLAENRAYREQLRRGKRK